MSITDLGSSVTEREIPFQTLRLSFPSDRPVTSHDLARLAGLLEKFLGRFGQVYTSGPPKIVTEPWHNLIGFETRLALDPHGVIGATPTIVSRLGNYVTVASVPKFEPRSYTEPAAPSVVSTNRKLNLL